MAIRRYASSRRRTPEAGSSVRRRSDASRGPGCSLLGNGRQPIAWGRRRRSIGIRLAACSDPSGPGIEQRHEEGPRDLGLRRVAVEMRAHGDRALRPGALKANSMRCADVLLGSSRAERSFDVVLAAPKSCRPEFRRARPEGTLYEMGVDVDEPGQQGRHLQIDGDPARPPRPSTARAMAAMRPSRIIDIEENQDLRNRARPDARRRSADFARAAASQ